MNLVSNQYTLSDSSRFSNCGSIFVCKANIVERKIVVHSGLEPAAFRLQIFHFPNWATKPTMADMQCVI